jgi:hypothetical protein
MLRHHSISNTDVNILTGRLSRSRTSPTERSLRHIPIPRRGQDGAAGHENMFKNFLIIGDMGTFLRYSPARTGVASDG